MSRLLKDEKDIPAGRINPCGGSGTGDPVFDHTRLANREAIFSLEN